MQPERLAQRIAEDHDEPQDLLSFREERASNLPPSLAHHIADLYTYRGGERLEVSESVRQRINENTDSTTTIQTLTDAVRDDGNLLDMIPEPGTILQRLSQAFFTNGIHIHVQAEEDIPLQPIFHPFARPQIDLVLVTAQDDAEATILEGCSAPRSRPFRAGHTHIQADDESTIHHANIQHWKETSLLDATTGSGNITSDHFIAADDHIIEASTTSTILTPQKAFRAGDGFRLHDKTIEGEHEDLEHTTDQLTNLPTDYRTELQQILSLGD